MLCLSVSRCGWRGRLLRGHRGGLVDADSRAHVADRVDDHLDDHRNVFGGLVKPDGAKYGQQEGQVAEHGTKDVYRLRVIVLDLEADREGRVGGACQYLDEWLH